MDCHVRMGSKCPDLEICLLILCEVLYNRCGNFIKIKLKWKHFSFYSCTQIIIIHPIHYKYRKILTIFFNLVPSDPFKIQYEPFVFLTKVLYFQSFLKSVFPQLFSCHFLIYKEKKFKTLQKIKYMVIFELDELFHDKIPWHMLPLYSWNICHLLFHQ